MARVTLGFLSEAGFALSSRSGVGHRLIDGFRSVNGLEPRIRPDTARNHRLIDRGRAQSRVRGVGEVRRAYRTPRGANTVSPPHRCASLALLRGERLGCAVADVPQSFLAV